MQSETDASLASSGNCRHWATGLWCGQAVNSRQSDRRRRTPVGRACCDDVVVRQDGGGWKIEVADAGNVRCGVAAVHEVLGSLALEAPVNCHSERHIWQTIYDFLLVCHYNYGSILYRLQVIWSLKVIETGAIRKLGCGFLFAFHSNYGTVLI